MINMYPATLGFTAYDAKVLAHLILEIIAQIEQEETDKDSK